jgi:hypothetical protein
MSPDGSVLLCTFRHSERTAAVLDALRGIAGLRLLATVGHSPDGEVRVVDDGATGYRHRLLPLVLDALSGPFADLEEVEPCGPPVVLPDSRIGRATFGRLMSPGRLVVLAAVPDGSAPDADLADRMHEVVRAAGGPTLCATS